MLADVVDAKYPRAPLVGRDRGAHARRDGARRRLGVTQQLAERALARDADEHGAPERRQLVEPADQLEVVLDRLAEADSGVEADAVLGDPGGDGGAQLLLEEGRDLGGRIRQT